MLVGRIKNWIQCIWGLKGSQLRDTFFYSEFHADDSGLDMMPAIQRLKEANKKQNKAKTFVFY